MKKFKKPLLFALCLLPIALAGGWFSAQMQMNSLDESLIAQAVSQAGSREALQWISTIQPAVYALICGFLGYILAEKLGLMRPFRLEKPAALRVIGASLIGGAIFSLDKWTFGRWIPQVGASYISAGRFDASVWLASILYGGVIEEVMMRLFVMSLLALLIWKIFFRKDGAAPQKALIGANVIAALLFAAGHLPATQMAFGSLTPLILARCFLLNGAFGLPFGRFYRKYGIQYAMLSHALFHIVSRTIWLIL